MHSSILAWRIPWREEPGGKDPQDRKESATTKVTACTHTHAGLGVSPVGLTRVE